MGLGLWSRRMCGPSATPPSSVGWIHDSLLEAKDYVVVVVVRLSLDTSGDLTTVTLQLYFQRDHPID